MVLKLRIVPQAECTRWKGCFHTTNQYITAIPEAPCSDEQKCSVEDYEWRDVLGQPLFRTQREIAFLTTYWFEAPCNDEQKCSVEGYEWRDVLGRPQRELFIDNLLTRIHLFIEMISDRLYAM